MVQEMKDTPNTMIGFRVFEEVSKTEFTGALLPAIYELVQRTGTLNYLFEIDPSVKNYSFGRWLEESMELKSSEIWGRAAIVIHPQFDSFMISVLQRVIPGMVRIFPINDLEEAIHWVSGQSALQDQEMVFQEEDDKRD